MAAVLLLESTSRLIDKILQPREFQQGTVFVALKDADLENLYCQLVIILTNA